MVDVCGRDLSALQDPYAHYEVYDPDLDDYAPGKHLVRMLFRLWWGFEVQVSKVAYVILADECLASCFRASASPLP